MVAGSNQYRMSVNAQGMENSFLLWGLKQNLSLVLSLLPKVYSVTWHFVLQYPSMLRYLWRRILHLCLSPHLSVSFNLLCHFHLTEQKLGQ